MAGVKGRSGGARQGAGRKRRDPTAAWLVGGAPGKPKPPRPPKAGKACRDEVACPEFLGSEEKAIWRELAPLALEQKTLTVATAMAFGDLCRAIVFERLLAKAPLTAAGPDHRGMIAIVQAGRARFRLTADGKAVVDETPVDEWAEFDAPNLHVLKGGKA